MKSSGHFGALCSRFSYLQTLLLYSDAMKHPVMLGAPFWPQIHSRIEAWTLKNNNTNSHGQNQSCSKLNDLFTCPPPYQCLPPHTWIYAPLRNLRCNNYLHRKSKHIYGSKIRHVIYGICMEPLFHWHHGGMVKPSTKLHLKKCRSC